MAYSCRRIFVCVFDPEIGVGSTGPSSVGGLDAQLAQRSVPCGRLMAVDHSYFSSGSVAPANAAVQKAAGNQQSSNSYGPSILFGQLRYCTGAKTLRATVALSSGG